MIKTNKELVAACLNVVNNYKTLYVMGCFGAPLNQANKERYTKNHSFNMDPVRKEKILGASGDTFGFDCNGLIKGLLWGWNGDLSHPYGGAEYQSNGVPDISPEQMIAACSDVSEDFSTILPGELVYQPGHVGIYIGEGKAAECTEYEADGVQIQAVLPMGFINGLPCTGWTKHGKLPWISYEEEQVEPVPEAPKEEPKFYRVAVEGLPEAQARNLAQVYTDGGFQVTMEEMCADKPQEGAERIPQVGDVIILEARITGIRGKE